MDTAYTKILGINIASYPPEKTIYNIVPRTVLYSSVPYYNCSLVMQLLHFLWNYVVSTQTSQLECSGG